MRAICSGAPECLPCMRGNLASLVEGQGLQTVHSNSKEQGPGVQARLEPQSCMDLFCRASPSLSCSAPWWGLADDLCYLVTALPGFMCRDMKEGAAKLAEVFPNIRQDDVMRQEGRWSCTTSRARREFLAARPNIASRHVQESIERSAVVTRRNAPTHGLEKTRGLVGHQAAV